MVRMLPVNNYYHSINVFNIWIFWKKAVTLANEYIKSFWHAQYMICRVQGSKNCDKLSAEGSFDYAGSGMPHHKSTKLNSGYAWPAFEGGLPNSMNSSATVSCRSSCIYLFYCNQFLFYWIHLMVVAVSLCYTISFQPDFTAMGFPCARCGENLGYVFRGKGFLLCQRCSNAGSSWEFFGIAPLP